MTWSTVFHFSCVRPGVRFAAAVGGQQADQVLGECGYSAREIRALRHKKVVH